MVKSKHQWRFNMSKIICCILVGAILGTLIGYFGMVVADNNGILSAGVFIGCFVGALLSLKYTHD